MNTLQEARSGPQSMSSNLMHRSRVTQRRARGRVPVPRGVNSPQAVVPPLPQEQTKTTRQAWGPEQAS